MTYKPLNSRHHRFGTRMTRTMKLFMLVLTTSLLVLLLRYQNVRSYLSSDTTTTTISSNSSFDKTNNSISDSHNHDDYYYEEEEGDYKEFHNPSLSLFRPLVISGPSGVGKGTLITKLVDFYNHKIQDAIDSHEFTHDDDDSHDETNKNSNTHDIFAFSVSHTTRNPRPGEIDGVHYHFTNKEDMMKRIEKNEFIEHAEVHGNIYGTSAQSVQNVISSHKICILDIDIQGVRKVKENVSLLKPYFIFIAPPSMPILEKRLRDRHTETEEEILRRIGNSKSEVEYGTTPGNFDYVIVNDDLETAFLQLRDILEEWYPYLSSIPSPSYEF